MPPDRETLAALYLERTDTEIGQQYGVSASTVRRWRRQYAIESRPRGARTSQRRVARSVYDDELRAAVADQTSVAAVLRSLGLCETGTAHAAMKDRIASLDLDTSHFGRPSPVLGLAGSRVRLEDLLVRGRRFASHALMHKLWRAGLLPER